MNQWWKNPILQGEDNDYGQYDFMVTDLPKDYCRWEISKTAWADDCGHESHLRKCWSYHFRTYDGYDAQYGSDCWRCVLKDKIHSIKYKISRIIRHHKDVVKCAQMLHQTQLSKYKDFRICLMRARDIVNKTK